MSSDVIVSMKLTPKQAGALYVKTMKLEDEVKALKAERDAQAAQVAAIVSLAKELAHDAYWIASYRNRSDRHSDGFDADVREQFEEHWELNDKDKLLPEMCVAEILAQGGRAGFIAGFESSGEGFNGEYGPSEKRRSELADEYAATVRKGGE